MSASPNLRCGLCNEYLVNAVTVAGCMHSFCEECLLKNLSVSGTCPTKGCKKNVDKNGYRRDSTLQMLVYKFVPQMFFENAEKGSKGNTDVNNRKMQRELAQASTEICDPDELLSICLEFVPAPAVAKPDEVFSYRTPPIRPALAQRPPLGPIVCEECLLKNLSVSGTCPTKGCKKNVDKNGYRRDSTLQMLVYKFVPQMFFENAEKGSKGNTDVNNRKMQRELAQASTEICDPDELLSICLEFVPAPAVAKPDEEVVSTNPSTSSSSKAEPPLKKMKKMREHREVQQSFRRFFRCAAKVPIRIVRRLLETKLFLTDQFTVHFISDRDFQDIPDDVTLRTLVLDGGFDRTRPFRLFFTLIPNVNDDAPPVLDAETMPCLMPEAPVHQEAPSTIQPPGQLQPVQLVSPVVPALTVSLSTDIYGHSAPIITPQCAPRKRRKLSDPKKSPTEKSPTTVAHPTPLAPNMLVGPLIRPMFIAQPPFIHRSPPNMHISMPYTQPPQNSNTVENSPPKQCASVCRTDNNVDQPPLLHREDPMVSVVPPPTLEPSPSSFTDIQKAPNPPQIPQPPVQFVPQEGSSKTSKVEKNVKPKPPPLPEASSMSMESRPKAVTSVYEPHPMPSYPFYMNSTTKSLEPPPRLDAMTSHARQQPSEKKQSSRANSSQNGFVNSSTSKGKPNNSPALPITPDHLRSVQTVLPQSLGGDIRAMPILPRKLEETQPPPTSANFDPRMDMAAARMGTGAFTSPDHAAPPPPPTLPNATTVTAPMDFRRMATLNKQSLGRTLQAVLSSGRADVTKNTVTLPCAGAGDVASGGAPMDARPTPLNGKIPKEAAVDLRFPNSKSLST
ncbi:zinc finger, C3HC4 type [Ostertagia ostertagi]